MCMRWLNGYRCRAWVVAYRYKVGHVSGRIPCCYDGNAMLFTCTSLNTKKDSQCSSSLFFLESRRDLQGFATCVKSEFMSSRAVGRAGSTLCGMNHLFAVVLAGKELRCACLIAALVGDCVAPRRRENPKICLWFPAAFKICFAALIRILFFLLWEWICSQTVLSTIRAARWKFFAGVNREITFAFDV